MGHVVELAAVRDRQARGLQRPQTKAEVAEHFAVSTRTISRWMERGLPFDKPFEGGSVRFDLRDCQDWFTRRR